MLAPSTTAGSASLMQGLQTIFIPSKSWIKTYSWAKQCLGFKQDCVPYSLTCWFRRSCCWAVSNYIFISYPSPLILLLQKSQQKVKAGVCIKHLVKFMGKRSTEGLTDGEGQDRLPAQPTLRGLVLKEFKPVASGSGPVLKQFSSELGETY